MNTIRIKRIYAEPSVEDGFRVLVDRLWPRGVSREKAFIDFWAKSITPSTEIRKEFHHKLDKWGDFRTKYIDELNGNDTAPAFINELKEKLKEANVTLLYAAKSETINHAVILKEWLDAQL